MSVSNINSDFSQNVHHTFNGCFFLQHTFEGSWIHPKAGNIIGALDLGGASTQISFTPKDPVKDPNSAFNLQLYGYKYELYTYSYLCYGKDQALKKLQAYLHKVGF